MDPEGDKKNTQKHKTSLFPQREETTILQGHVPDDGNVFSTFRIRCPFQIDNESNRVILDGRYHFLFYFGMFFYVLLFTYEILK